MQSAWPKSMSGARQIDELAPHSFKLYREAASEQHGKLQTRNNMTNSETLKTMSAKMSGAASGFNQVVSLVVGTTNSSLSGLERANASKLALQAEAAAASAAAGSGEGWLSSAGDCDQPHGGDQLYVNMSTFWYCFLAFVTSVGLMVSLVSNMIIIYLFFGTPSFRRNPSNIIAVNLSLSDLLYCIQWPSVIYCSLSQSTWLLEIDFVCKTFGFITVTTASASVLTVLAMSVERAIVIKYSIQAKSRYTIRSAWLIVVLIWCVSIASSLPPLFDNFNRYTLDPSKTSCTLDYLSGKTHFKLYMLIIYIIYWILPATLITICYLFIMLTFKRSSRRLVAVGAASCGRSSEAVSHACDTANESTSADIEATRVGGGRRLSKSARQQRSIRWSSAANAAAPGNLRRASTTRLPRVRSSKKDERSLALACEPTSESGANLNDSGSRGGEPLRSDDGQLIDPTEFLAACRLNEWQPACSNSIEAQWARVAVSQEHKQLEAIRTSSMAPPALELERRPKINPIQGSNERQQEDPGEPSERGSIGVSRGRRLADAPSERNSLNRLHLAMTSASSHRSHNQQRNNHHHQQLGLDELAIARLHASQRAHSNGLDSADENNDNKRDATADAGRLSPLTGAAVTTSDFSGRNSSKAHGVKLAIISRVMAQLNRQESAGSGGSGKLESTSMPTSTTATTTTTTCHFGNSSSHSAARVNMQIRLAKMSFYLILLWLVSWTPIASLTLINLVVECHLQANALVVFLANTMTKLGPTFDVFIYGTSHPKIKRRFVQIIGQLLMLRGRGSCATEPNCRMESIRCHASAGRPVTRVRRPIGKSLTLNEEKMLAKTRRLQEQPHERVRGHSIPHDHNDLERQCE